MHELVSKRIRSSITLVSRTGPCKVAQLRYAYCVKQACRDAYLYMHKISTSKACAAVL